MELTALQAVPLFSPFQRGDLEHLGRRLRRRRYGRGETIFATGDQARLARAILRLAEADSVLISDATYRLIARDAIPPPIASFCTHGSPSSAPEPPDTERSDDVILELAGLDATAQAQQARVLAR